jgi:hypothetical protein
VLIRARFSRHRCSSVEGKATKHTSEAQTPVAAQLLRLLPCLGEGVEVGKLIIMCQDSRGAAHRSLRTTRLLCCWTASSVCWRNDGNSIGEGVSCFCSAGVEQQLVAGGLWQALRQQ